MTTKIAPALLGEGTGFNFLTNGDMSIDQRHAGAGTTTTANDIRYGADGFCLARNTTGGSITVQAANSGLAGFPKCFLLTVNTGVSPAAGDRNVVVGAVEGVDWAALAWGAAGASPATLSFWANANTAGLYSGAIANGAVNRSYPFSFTVNAASTWEFKSVTIPGDTSGVWASDVAAGVYVYWNVGTGANGLGAAGAWIGADHRGVAGSVNVMGTAGRNFALTGVKLERGNGPSPFQSLGRAFELERCQRWFESTFRPNVAVGPGSGVTNDALMGKGAGASDSEPFVHWRFNTPKREAPTVTVYNARAGGAAGHWSNLGADYGAARVQGANEFGVIIDKSGAALGAAGSQAYICASADASLI